MLIPGVDGRKRAAPGTRFRWMAFVLGASILAGILPAAGFDSGHEAWSRVLATHVRDGRVGYSALKKDPAELIACLDAAASVSRAQFDGWPQADQIAFLINLYNAATLKRVVDHYPVTSIRKIGGLFGNPWKLTGVRLWGESVSLDHIEHDLLRKRYREPRIHFALVCAAVSCPPLRPEAYTGERLDAQLNDQGILFLSQSSKNRLDPGTKTLWLSPIFDWFRGDFTAGDRTLEQFVSPYLSEPDRTALSAGGFRVRFTDYDWSLNDR